MRTINKVFISLILIGFILLITGSFLKLNGIAYSGAILTIALILIPVTLLGIVVYNFHRGKIIV